MKLIAEATAKEIEDCAVCEEKNDYRAEDAPALEVRKGEFLVTHPRAEFDDIEAGDYQVCAKHKHAQRIKDEGGYVILIKIVE